ncbi:MAG: hypothetical protein HY900_02995 [Deltaproteobacteria bacterium]|nr:hypothetical protein [Deltaproteobacteria bacterium]
MFDDADTLPRILPLEWGVDEAGHWPRVDLEVHRFGERVSCPRCESAWVLQETDGVFGLARREGNDLLFLARCASCRLPHRVRGVGFGTAYPAVIELMEGWLGWEKRACEFAAEEERLYGGR